MKIIGCDIAGNSGNRIIEVEASESSQAKREEEIFSELDARLMSVEDQEAGFQREMKALSARTEQGFPEVSCENTLKTESYPLGNVYTLENGDYERIVFYIHGGAWVSGLDPVHVNFCDALVGMLNAKVYMPDYPLAPNAGWKEGYAMLEAVYADLLKQNKPIFVMGDSAGGNLALGLVLKLKDEGVVLPEKVVGLAPCPDMALKNPDIMEVAKKDGMLPVRYCTLCAEEWADGADLTLPQLSPMYGDLTGFPETLIYCGTYDILYPDNMLFFEKLTASGVKATFVKGIGFWHVYLLSDTVEKPQLMKILEDFCLE